MGLAWDLLAGPCFNSPPICHPMRPRQLTQVAGASFSQPNLTTDKPAPTHS